MAESQRPDEDAADTDRGPGDLRAGAAGVRARRPGHAARAAAGEGAAQRGAPGGGRRRLRSPAPAGSGRSPARARARDAQAAPLRARDADPASAALRRLSHRRRAAERGVGREPGRAGGRPVSVGARAGRASARVGRARRSDRCARRGSEPAAMARRALGGSAGTRADTRARRRAESASSAYRARESPEEHARRAARDSRGGGVSGRADPLVADGADLHGQDERVRPQGVQGRALRGARRGQPVGSRGMPRASRSARGGRVRRRWRQDAGAGRRDGQPREDRRMRSRRQAAG